MKELGPLARLSREIQRRRAAAVFARGLVPPSRREFAAFGERSFIAPPARVLNPQCIEIGDDVMIHIHARLSVVAPIDGPAPSLVIGDRCHIGRFATIACTGQIVFEDDVLTADRIFVGDSSHEYAAPHAPVADQGMSPPKPVRIMRGAFLGVGSVVLPGVTVGANAFVAAGAVVTADVTPRTLVVGNPARPVKRWNDERADWEPVGRSAS
jgi:acetyltransferase-like isoleucine patch superfamily enzyme